MSDMTIITNNVPRDILDGWDVPPDARAQFDYIDWDAVDEGTDSVSFLRYKGEWFDLGEFTRVENLPSADHPLAAWHGIHADTFFSGTLVRYADTDGETIIVGRYFA